VRLAGGQQEQGKPATAGNDIERRRTASDHPGMIEASENPRVRVEDTAIRPWCYRAVVFVLYKRNR
jgi:hypothetical protein